MRIIRFSQRDMQKGPLSLTGWTLARAHARSGKAPEIRGYLGKKNVFDDALVKFATDYADQAERDHAAFLKAIRSGRINATPQE